LGAAWKVWKTLLFAELVRDSRLKLDKGMCWVFTFSMGLLTFAFSPILTATISTDNSRLDLLTLLDDCKRDARGRSGESGVDGILMGEVSIILGA
jgi:hypothetical protein